MSANSNIDAISAFGDIRVDRPAIARQQLLVSIGTAAVMLMIAVVAICGRSPLGSDQLASSVGRTPGVIQTTVRDVPSSPMQAVDQTKADRGS